MNCAIYSAGPSIKALAANGKAIAAHERAYPLRIGVNSAICFLPDAWLHWYAAGDSRCYAASYTGHHPSTGWCAMNEIERGTVMADASWSRLPSMTWADLPDLLAIHPKYSITAAIALAASLKARAVTVYAHDAAIGQGSACGRFSDRYPIDRAAVEADHISTIVANLRNRGIPTYFAKGTP